MERHFKNRFKYTGVRIRYYILTLLFVSVFLALGMAVCYFTLEWNEIPSWIVSGVFAGCMGALILWRITCKPDIVVTDREVLFKKGDKVKYRFPYEKYAMTPLLQTIRYARIPAATIRNLVVHDGKKERCYITNLRAKDFDEMISLVMARSKIPAPSSDAPRG